MSGNEIDRREFVSLGAGSLVGLAVDSSIGAVAANVTAETRCMLATASGSGFRSTVLATTGESFAGYRPPGIMDGMGAWRWSDTTVRLFVNHELSPDDGYEWQLENGTRLRGARISWFDIDVPQRAVRAAGQAIASVRDRRGNAVTDSRQISERMDEDGDAGFNCLCSAQGFAAGEFGFRDDLLFTHEEVSSREDHPHGGSIWVLDIRQGEIWALPELGRGSWENVTAIATPDQDRPNGHVALLLSDDLEFGGAPLYLWIGRKRPAGNLIERNGLAEGQLYAWVSGSDAASPEDWNGTGTLQRGSFTSLDTRNLGAKGTDGHDRDGYLNDTLLRAQAFAAGAFAFSRPEDLHTNPDNGLQVVFCSTGHGETYPADDWGTIYMIDMLFEAVDGTLRPSANIRIIHDADHFGDYGVRSPDNVVWASDGMIYVHEDKATRLHPFGSQTGREASTWQIDPRDPAKYRRVAEIDRSVVLPGDARDLNAQERGAWECCGLIDVSRQFSAPPNELLLITAVQAHSVRGGALGGAGDLVQGGQLVLIGRKG